MIQLPNRPAAYSLEAITEIVAAEAARLYARRLAGIPLGPVTPFPKLTELWGGYIPNGLHMILGSAGDGKTALALQIAAGCGCPCLYISCEMTIAELLRRITARETTTYLNKFKDGTYSEAATRSMVATSIASSPNLFIAKADEAYADIPWIEEQAQITRGDSEDLLIILDSAHSWLESADKETKGESSEYEVTNLAVRDLRNLAKRLKCPIIAIAERNRASANKGAPKDKLGAAAGSRKWEYGAETIMNLDRDEDQPKEHGAETRITLTINKNRNGQSKKTVHFCFAGGFQRYSEGDNA